MKLKIKTYISQNIKKTHLLESKLKKRCKFGHEKTLTDYLSLFTSSISELYLNI